jgi:predicted permease
MISIRQIFRRRLIHDDLAEEIQEHLAEQTDALMAEGMSRADAEAAARRKFGNVTLMEEKGREAWQLPRVEGWIADLKFALRKLCHSPGFAFTSIATLTLGIGANVIVFSILNGLILRPMHVPDVKNLYQIARGKDGGEQFGYPDYRDFRDRNASFNGILAYKFLSAGMQVDDTTIRSWGYAASGNYFDVLDVKPALGRLFHAGDEHGLGSAPYVVLSYDFWHRQFGANHNVLGRTVKLNQHPFVVIGVAPEGFRGTDVFFWPDYWMPVANAQQVTDMDDYCCRDHLAFNVMGRLKPGVTPQQASENLNALAIQMAREDKKDDGLTLRLRQPGPAGDENDPTKKGLLGIMLLAALVLLAACANLASIFAGRAADRAGELAVRMAIGASRWIVLRQLLAGAALVSLAGGLAGSLVARLVLAWLVAWQPFANFPARLPVLPDAKVYLVAVALSLASGIFFGLMPARQIWRTDVVQAIKTGYVMSESFRRFALRDVLLAVQIVVCTLLVTASVVAIRGMERLMHVPLGFNPAGATIAQAELSMAGYTADNAMPVQKRIFEEARVIPGVTAAALSDGVPLATGGSDWFVYKWGTTEFMPSHMAFDTSGYLVSPEYLAAAQTPLIAGRNFTWHDDKSAPAVAMVNETFARKLFGNESPIGKHFVLWATAKYEIVGEVADGKYFSVGEKDRPLMLIPFAQGIGGYLSTSVTVLVRSQLPQDKLNAALGAVMKREAPAAPYSIQPWSDRVDLSLTMIRAVTLVLGVLGSLAAVLALTGIFGMTSYSVSKRMKEHGIRIALGAERVQVLRAALGRPALVLCCGSAAGMVAAAMTSRIAARLGFFATPKEPLVLVSVGVTMMMVGVAATWIPARRALRVDPAQLLREG